jgi:ADP-ribose pyrophosphatase YjhB (NUDIX family)/ribosomal protein S18 acetylase RimI-like enzyme
MRELIYCPVCGHKLIERELGGRPRKACANCGYVHYVNPVPAVGILIEMDGGVVLIRRGQPPHQGEWTLPSGFIEADESAEEAAVREAEEETGLQVEIIDLAGINSFPEGPPTSGIIIFFRVRPLGGELRGGDDALEARVFLPEAMPRLPFRTHREVMATWLEARSASSPTAADDSTHEYLVRPAEARDIDEIMALIALIPANRALSDDEWSAVELRLRESAGVEVFVAQATSTPPIILGFLALSIVRTLTGGRGFINDMAVLPTYQRRGIGAALLEAALRRAQRLSLRTMLVNTRQNPHLDPIWPDKLGMTHADLRQLPIPGLDEDAEAPQPES